MNTDKPLGAGLIALGLAGIWASMQITVRTFNDDPGPKLFPIFAFAILILCGIGMLAFVKPYDHKGPSNAALMRGGVMAVLFVGYGVALWLFGFHIATVVMVYLFYHLIAGPDRRKLWVGAVYAVLVTAGVHFVFASLLNSFLPQGILIRSVF